MSETTVAISHVNGKKNIKKAHDLMKALTMNKVKHDGVSDKSVHFKIPAHDKRTVSRNLASMKIHHDFLDEGTENISELSTNAIRRYINAAEKDAGDKMSKYKKALKNSDLIKDTEAKKRMRKIAQKDANKSASRGLNALKARLKIGESAQLAEAPGRLAYKHPVTGKVRRFPNTPAGKEAGRTFKASKAPEKKPSNSGRNKSFLNSLYNKIEMKLSAHYPDGDPIDIVGSMMKKDNFTWDDVDAALKANKKKSLYDIYDDLGSLYDDVQHNEEQLHELSVDKLQDYVHGAMRHSDQQKWKGDAANKLTAKARTASSVRRLNRVANKAYDTVTKREKGIAKAQKKVMNKIDRLKEGTDYNKTPKFNSVAHADAHLRKMHPGDQGRFERKYYTISDHPKDRKKVMISHLMDRQDKVDELVKKHMKEGTMRESKTGNPHYGYHGYHSRDQKKSPEEADKAYAKTHGKVKRLTGAEDITVKHYLDSRHGRHLGGKEHDTNYIKKDFRRFKKTYNPQNFVEAYAMLEASSADRKPQKYVGRDGKTHVRMVPVDNDVVRDKKNTRKMKDDETIEEAKTIKFNPKKDIKLGHFKNSERTHIIAKHKGKHGYDVHVHDSVTGQSQPILRGYTPDKFKSKLSADHHTSRFKQAGGVNWTHKSMTEATAINEISDKAYKKYRDALNKSSYNWSTHSRDSVTGKTKVIDHGVVPAGNKVAGSKVSSAHKKILDKDPYSRHTLVRKRIKNSHKNNTNESFNEATANSNPKLAAQLAARKAQRAKNKQRAQVAAARKAAAAEKPKVTRAPRKKTSDIRDASERNIIMQLRKAHDVDGNHDIEFRRGKGRLEKGHISNILRVHDALQKPEHKRLLRIKVYQNPEQAKQIATKLGKKFGIKEGYLEEATFTVNIDHDDYQKIRKASMRGNFPHKFTRKTNGDTTFKTGTPKKLANDLEKLIDSGETSWNEILDVPGYEMKMRKTGKRISGFHQEGYI